MDEITSRLPPDGRQSENALKIARGTARLLHAHGFSMVSELPLPSGRRADLVALDAGGEIWIVEIKSSVADFRADQKWQDYRLHCDRLFFATSLEVPCEIFPPDTGLIVADAFGAEFKCDAPEHKLPVPVPLPDGWQVFRDWIAVGSGCYATSSMPAGRMSPT